ncbi:response regulator [Roseateles sp. DAIF2]|uniref:PAS domain-containing hybrid sensor histidine kinase/response regulator n=1 Tax=Roseateles sp. DAIF2 TaxID=2714952 RepID=UPI0018A2F6AD|nr:PAS domain-containing sensor histidine kinase [Roseateles sp. DAIF2]QPF76054.1 response regulator [Roseateles sp. DAIF2]
MDSLRNKRLEQALHAAEANFRYLADNLPGLMFQYVLWPDGQDAIYEMSPRCLELLELEPAEVERDVARLWGLVAPTDRAALRASLLRSARELTPWHVEFRLVTPSGRRLWLQGAGRPQPRQDGTVLWHALLLDISAARQAEQALQDSESRFRALLEGVEKVSVQGYDAQRRVIFWNAASEQLYGFSKAEALGRQLEELIIPPPMRPFVIEATREWLASGKVSTPAEELVLQHKNGSPVHVFSSHTMQRNSHGEAELYCVDIDLGERVQAEARRQELETQLREAQKLEAMGRLAGGIAHDFNNILGAVLGNVALALEQLPASHPASTHLGLIRIGGERARSLVQQILAFSRRQPQELRAVRLQPLVQESLALLRAATPAGVQLELNLCEEPLFVRADATQIQQVLMNLCTNAWHALDGRPGTVEVGLAAERLAGAAPRVHLWVRDDGKGMDQITRSHLFEPFFTTKPQGQGTGLGLAVAHGIVLAHQGEIQVDSTPGQGSCFHLYLPLLDWDGPATEPAPLLDLEGRGEGQHIVYVDDDEVMRLTVQGLLLRQGYRVSLAGDAAQALTLVAAGDVDLLVSDYNMPGTTGLALARELRSRAPALPVLISSGHITEELRAQARLLGLPGLLQKEKTLEDLAGLVQRVLG